MVDGDVHNSTRTEWFAKEFPERFFNVGIAESNMVGVTAGLASAGHAALCSSFACFLICNAYEQIRMAVAYPLQHRFRWRAGLRTARWEEAARAHVTQKVDSTS